MNHRSKAQNKAEQKLKPKTLNKPQTMTNGLLWTPIKVKVQMKTKTNPK
jgi:hypothetical protein